MRFSSTLITDYASAGQHRHRYSQTSGDPLTPPFPDLRLLMWTRNCKVEDA